MRISLVALLCTVGFAASGTLADDKADQEPTLDTAQPEHKLLERFAGSGSLKNRSHQRADQSLKTSARE